MKRLLNQRSSSHGLQAKAGLELGSMLVEGKNGIHLSEVTPSQSF
jgi:hypothetical protein